MAVEEQQLPQAIVEEDSGISVFWIIPVIACLVAAWLIFKVYSEKGDIVTLTFDNAEGIEIKKTVVRYKDVTVGKVVDIGLDRKLEKVEIKTEIYPSMAKHLGPESKFWVVRPVVSVTGVSGLSTLISGIYISVDPGPEGKARKVYQGLDSPPRVSSYDRGSTFTLEAENLGDLEVGSPVYYRKINVGEVVSYELSDETDTLQITIFIKEPFHEIVKQNSHFWNVSGLQVALSPSGGLEVRMNTLTSLLLGGIAFETPQNLLDKLPVRGDTVFVLYDTQEDAWEKTQGARIDYVMYFDESLRGLERDAPIEYRGIKIGRVEHIELKIEEATEEIRIPVQISLYAEKLSFDGDKDDAADIVQQLVENGLRGQLATSNFLTGTQYIELVFPDGEEMEPATIIHPEEGSVAYSEFPTVPGLTSMLAQSATDIIDEIHLGIQDARRLINSPELASSKADIAKILEEVRSLLVEVKPEVATTIKNMESFTGKLDDQAVPLATQLRKTMMRMDSALVEARSTLKNANTALGEDSALQYELRLLIEEVSEAANSFSVLADTLQRKPNSVIFGK